MLVEGNKGWTWFHSKSKKKLLKMIHRGKIAYDIKPKDVHVMHPLFAEEVTVGMKTGQAAFDHARNTSKALTRRQWRKPMDWRATSTCFLQQPTTPMVRHTGMGLLQSRL